MAREPRRGPGLVKARSDALVARRSVPLLRSSDYRLRELFERADVMSEGKTREETEGRVYYGSTSVLLPFVSRGGRVPDEQAAEIQALLACDPHARVRAIRVACLEAQVRARGPIGRVRAELFVRRERRGLRIDVEVEARVFDEASERAPARRSGAGKRRSER